MQDLDYIKKYTINNLEELSNQIQTIQLLDKKIITFDIQNIARSHPSSVGMHTEITTK